MSERLRRLPEAARALLAQRRLERHESWSAQQLADHRQQRFVAIVRHAVANSGYYREAFAGIELSDDLDPRALPKLDKQTMLDCFDQLVTDRRLTLDSVDRHLADLARSGRDELLHGRYRAMASGGTSGRRGVYVYGREDWSEVIGGVLRAISSYNGMGPRLPRRRKLVAILAGSPLHMTNRMSRSVDVGVQRMLRIDARTPIPEIVESLNRFQPEGLNSYASVAALLAEEQLAGRLRIAPQIVVTTSEVRTAEMREQIVAAWGLDPFDAYASTETGMLAADCSRHTGMHVFEDLVQVEVVDERGEPVRPGQPGHRLLVTNLINRTQPLIRMELTDLVTMSPEPCPCGRPFPLLTALDGRTDDILRLPGLDGGTVAVHPLTIRSPLAGIAGLKEYYVVYDSQGLHVRAVVEGGAATTGEAQARLRTALQQRGVNGVTISVEQVDTIPRHPNSGKRKLIESRG